MARLSEDANLNVRIPKTLRDIMAAHVTRDCHINKSEFVRDAIREKLQREAADLYLPLIQKHQKAPAGKAGHLRVAKGDMKIEQTS